MVFTQLKNRIKAIGKKKILVQVNIPDTDIPFKVLTKTAEDINNDFKVGDESYILHESAIFLIKKKMVIIFDKGDYLPRFLVGTKDIENLVKNQKFDASIVNVLLLKKTLKQIFGAFGFDWIAFAVGLGIAGTVASVVLVYMITLGKLVVH